MAAYKSETVADIRAASTMLARIVDETSMHLRYCEGWGLTPAQVEAMPEAKANMAYTRFVLEAGMAGDLLDLCVALAPCVVGYAEIGQELAAKQHATITPIVTGSRPIPIQTTRMSSGRPLRGSTSLWRDVAVRAVWRD